MQPSTLAIECPIGDLLPLFLLTTDNRPTVWTIFMSSSFRLLRSCWAAGLPGRLLGLSVMVGCSIVASWCAGECAASEQAAVGDATQYALLVGCTKYPHNPRIPELWGPANDVPAFAKLLHQRFGFPTANIQQLVGWPDDPDQRPTCANITAGFERLISAAAPGVQIVILMSGHGTQLPIPESQASAMDPNNPEYDGLDEVFLPADVKPWTDGQPENALLDDQLGQWLDQLKARGAAVWIVFDCCHSGTMTRSIDAVERQRGVPPQILGVPNERLEAAAEKRRSGAAQAGTGEQSRGPQSREIDGVDIVAGAPADDQAGRITAFYAAQAFETAPELPRPADAPRTPENYYGLLSYVLLQTFETQTASLTYRDLGRRVISRYRSERGSRSPTPFFSGDLDGEVLGRSLFPERTSIVLEKTAGATRVAAGEWMGLAPNTILAVYPPDLTLDDKAILGYLRVIKVTPDSSEVQPCEYAGQPARPIEQFPDFARCAIVFQELGDMRLKLAFEAEPATDVTVLAEALRAMPQAIADLVHVVDVADEPQWRLRIVSPAVAQKKYNFHTDVATVLLVDANAQADPAAEPHAPAAAGRRRLAADRVYGPYPLHDSTRLARRLAIDLQKLFSWQNTWRIAELAAQEHARGNSKLELQVTRQRPANDGPDSVESAPTKLNPGDRLQVRVHNRGLQDMWVTLLYLDADNGIHVWLTEALQAGAQFTDGGTVDASSLGPEGFIVLATPVRGQKLQPRYEFLQQDGLSTHSRGVRTTVARSLNPFEQLMAAAAFGKGQQRGLRRKVDSTPQVLSWSWVTVLED